MYNYTARSSKELSFKKGDIIQVYKRSNSDWWDGCLDGVDGYVPCAYIRILDEDNIDADSNKDSPPGSICKPQSLPLDRQSISDDVLPSPPSTRATPITPTGYRSGIAGDDVTRTSQLQLRYNVKSSTPEVIPEDQHLSSFKQSSSKRPDSPTMFSNSLERSRSLEHRDSPKTVDDGTKTTSLPRSSQLWQKRGVEIKSPTAAEVRGIAEGMNSPGVEMATQSRVPPPAPKPKPKPKVPKRHSNPSTELIASLQAGTMARTARESREEVPDVPNELPASPPCCEREVIGGELPSPPRSPISKQDTFL